MSMKILDNGTTPMTNHEVLSIIQQKKSKWAQQGRSDAIPANVKYITNEVCACTGHVFLLCTWS